MKLLLFVAIYIIGAVWGYLLKTSRRDLLFWLVLVVLAVAIIIGLLTKSIRYAKWRGLSPAEKHNGLIAAIAFLFSMGIGYVISSALA